MQSFVQDSDNEFMLFGPRKMVLTLGLTMTDYSMPSGVDRTTMTLSPDPSLLVT